MYCIAIHSQMIKTVALKNKIHQSLIPLSILFFYVPPYRFHTNAEIPISLISCHAIVCFFKIKIPTGVVTRQIIPGTKAPAPDLNRRQQVCPEAKLGTQTFNCLSCLL